jgi:hypothetical protein
MGEEQQQAGSSNLNRILVWFGPPILPSFENRSRFTTRHLFLSFITPPIQSKLSLVS